MDAFVVQHRDFEREITLHVFDDHDEEWQLDAKCATRIRGAANICRAHVIPSNFKNR